MSGGNRADRATDPAGVLRQLRELERDILVSRHITCSSTRTHIVCQLVFPAVELRIYPLGGYTCCATAVGAAH